MSDFSRYLPLSQRGGHDESGVSTDWSNHVRAALTLVTDVLDTMSAADWTSESAHAGWTIREQVGRIVWRVGNDRRARLTSIFRLSTSELMLPRTATDTLARRTAVVPTDQLMAALRSLAVDTSRRRPVSDLATVLLHGYAIARPLGRTLAFDPRATGAVALARSLSAPVEIKAVLSGVELVATDGDWSVGRGTKHLASGEAIIRFLYGRDAAALDVSPPAEGA